MMEDDDRLKMAESLMDWFKSNNINEPANAVDIMTTLMALQIVNRTQDRKALFVAAETIKASFLLNCSEQLRLQEEANKNGILHN